MEQGVKSKKTIFVGGISDDTDETSLYQAFSPFGDIVEVQLPPPAQTHRTPSANEPKHRGFAFVTFGSTTDAQDAIDNMDMNELGGKVLKVNIARPGKTGVNLGGNRAIWESEDWLKEHVKPLAQSGGVTGRMARRAGDTIVEEDKQEDDEQEGEAMEE